MESTVKLLWLIPALPLFGAGIGALLKQKDRGMAASIAVGSMALSFLFALRAFIFSLHSARVVYNFEWFAFGTASVQLGWVLDPLSAIMLLMVTFVSLLIFIYSIGYMAHDWNFTRFFCFLGLFAAAMLGIIISNSLLLLFICWELVGLASYLLIGFWFHKPSAAAAAKKAFITTRIGDIGLLLGMLWLYASSGTLVFYDNGHGCLEHLAGGKTVLTLISLLIFCGAVGKSGQVPLHVWLPDAMEGPTPVSALIHAATMVAAGVFLMARVYPLMAGTEALHVVTWVGAITALFAAMIAVGQNDIKRILAYSTISQLGYMMMGLGVGGVAIGMFHLITHAFFKALLFLGAGSVIHGSHDEQDIRQLGGLKKLMPLTFATYAVGMMALCGVPLVFSGFWSKDAILHAAGEWPVSRVPFYLGAAGAFLTAFYMTRQMFYVFFGTPRNDWPVAHESPSVMTVPLSILAVFAVVAGFFGTPAWPWFEAYLHGGHATFEPAQLFSGGHLNIMVISTTIVGAAIGLGGWIYRDAATGLNREVDALEKLSPAVFRVLRNKFYVDELYEATVIRANAAFAALSDWLDAVIWNGAILVLSAITNVMARLARGMDETVVNGGFDRGCEDLRSGGKMLSLWENGQVQSYLRVIGFAVAVLVMLLVWRWA